MTQDSQPLLLSHRAYDRLLALLSDGQYAANDRLPSEERLASELRISRPVLRQALERLRLEKRIYSRKGSGHYVSPANLATPAIAYSGLTSIPDVRDFLTFRMSIEMECAALAAQSDPMHHDAVKVAHLAMKKALGTGQSSIDEDLAFHVSIARASGNRFYSLTMDSIAEQMRFSIRLIRDLSQQTISERKSDIILEHEEITEAISAREPERARQAMKAHLLGGKSRLFGDRG
ncbi:FCD domain-containing protein [Paraburkholderia sp. Ac-20347]|uniref:FCD domain-containing protein n=1 Tax=Paraburkholderia sp. Ac-20347 TaxID=2703892 RepID=UPI0019816D13|nr:FadR family transcriptional regulator [Paraburkholderia sp. Ac-20347]